MATAVGIEEKRRKAQALEEVDNMMPALSVTTSQDDLNDSQWGGLGESVTEENESVRDVGQVKRPRSRQSRQGSSSGASNLRNLSRPSAEARARWAMLASLAGVSHNEHSDHARDEITSYQEQDRDDGKTSQNSKVPENTSATTFLEMPDPDDFVRLPLNKDGIKIETERLKMAEGLSPRKFSNVIDEVEASVEHGVFEGTNTIRSASFSEVVDVLDNVPQAASRIKNSLEDMASGISAIETVAAEKIESDVRKAHNAIATANVVLENCLQSDLTARSNGARERSGAVVNSIISSMSSHSKEIDHEVNKTLDTLQHDKRKLPGKQQLRREMLLETPINGHHDHIMNSDSVVEAKLSGKRTQEGLEKVASKPENKAVGKPAPSQQPRPLPQVDNKGNHSKMSSQHKTSALHELDSSKVDRTIAPKRNVNEAASHAPSNARARNAAIDFIRQQKTPLAGNSMPLRMATSEAKSLRPERAVQDPALHKATQNHRQIGLQQAPGHLLNEDVTQDRAQNPNQNRLHKISGPGRADVVFAELSGMKAAPAHNDSKTGLSLSGGKLQCAVKQTTPDSLPAQSRSELNRFSPRAVSSTQTPAETHPIQPIAAREGRRTTQDDKTEPGRSVVATDKPTPTMGCIPVRSSSSLEMPRKDSKGQVLQHQQRQGRLPVIEQPTSKATAEVASAKMRAQPGRGDHPDLKSITPPNAKSQRRQSNSNLGMPENSPRKALSDVSAPIHIFPGSYKGAETTLVKEFEHGKPNLSKFETQTRTQERELSSSIHNDPTLETSNDAVVDPDDVAPESFYPSGDPSERQQGWPPSNIMEHPLDYEEEEPRLSEMQPPTAENIVNGIESYLDAFEQQQRKTFDTAKDGQAGFLDTMIQLVIDMARDAMPEVRRRLEENGFVADSDAGGDVR